MSVKFELKVNDGEVMKGIIVDKTIKYIIFESPDPKSHTSQIKKILRFARAAIKVLEESSTTPLTQ